MDNENSMDDFMSNVPKDVLDAAEEQSQEVQHALGHMLGQMFAEREQMNYGMTEFHPCPEHMESGNIADCEGVPFADSEITAAIVSFFGLLLKPQMLKMLEILRLSQDMRQGLIFAKAALEETVGLLPDGQKQMYAQKFGLDVK